MKPRACACAMTGAVLALLLSACAINAPVREAPALYDLGEDGTGRERARSIPGTLLIPPVGSPSWLETSGIVYRLNYDDPKRLRAYSNSRWAASPAMLLTEELRSRFAGPAEGVVSATDGAHADHVLRLYLEDYTQSFDRPEASRVGIRARATLVDTSSRNVVAQKTFQIDREAPPNAAGAASALARGTDELVQNLLDWVAQNLNNKGVASTARRNDP
jgi:cholesterol transport system auxiliary component